MAYCHGQLMEFARPIEEEDGVAEFVLTTLQSILHSSAALDGYRYEIKRSGSTTNGTNVEHTSDFDFQVRLHSESDPPGISPESTVQERYSAWQEFSNSIEHALTTESETGVTVQRTNKCLNMQHPDLLSPIDILPCLDRTVLARDLRTNVTAPTQAIEFWTHDELAERIVSFPDVQLVNSRRKAESTEGVYPATVRALKNMRREQGIVPEVARSYHIQSLVYSMPDNRFTDGVFEAVKNAVDYMRDPSQIPEATMVHHRYGLFGTGSVQWQPQYAAEFTRALSLH